LDLKRKKNVPQLVVVAAAELEPADIASTTYLATLAIIQAAL
jgi:hypothetical protein